MDEHLLCHVFRFDRIAKHAMDEIQDGMLVPLHEFIKCSGVTALNTNYEFYV